MSVTPPLAAVRIASFILSLALGVLVVSCASSRFGPVPPGTAKAPPRSLKELTLDERNAILRRAKAWRPINTASLDLLGGPPGRQAFRFNEEVSCEYVYPDTPLSGATPKFRCRLGPDEVVKVKYGRRNREVYAEVAATRLLWAAGFSTDHWYPVRVMCENCPENPWAASQAEWFKGRPRFVTRRMLDPAALEREIEGAPVETPGFKGWSWSELDQVDPKAGGASRAEIDALKLMAVFLQHSDSKHSQQELLCLPEGIRRDAEGNETCTAPRLTIKDVGTTFGKPTRLNLNKMDLEAWRSQPIWLDAEACVGNLHGSLTGTLIDPKIGEAGRRLLAQRLALSDRQIRDLFTAARPERFEQTIRDREGRVRAATIDDWVDAFKDKRAQIVNQSCTGHSRT